MKKLFFSLFLYICTSWGFLYNPHMSLLPTNFTLSPRRRLIRGSFIIIGVGMMIYSFFSKQDTREDHTLWVIDNSLSMAVSDIHTQSGIMISRLELAKQFVSRVSPQLSGEQAIMSAAYAARLELPMTDDRWLISNVIHGITTLARWWGSMVSLPLETIRLIYGNVPHLRIIWLTDGEFADSGSTLSGFVSPPDITYIGIGTRLGWPILLGYNADGHPRYKESGWKQVNSIRDDTTLEKISRSHDANLIFLDSDRFPDIGSIIRSSSRKDNDISLLMLFGIFSTIIWLMYPRYIYHSFSSTWK